MLNLLMHSRRIFSLNQIVLNNGSNPCHTKYRNGHNLNMNIQTTYKTIPTSINKQHKQQGRVIQKCHTYSVSALLWTTEPKLLKSHDSAVKLKNTSREKFIRGSSELVLTRICMQLYVYVCVNICFNTIRILNSPSARKSMTLYLQSWSTENNDLLVTVLLWRVLTTSISLYEG